MNNLVEAVCYVILGIIALLVVVIAKKITLQNYGKMIVFNVTGFRRKFALFAYNSTIFNFYIALIYVIFFVGKAIYFLLIHRY